jgi:hypothetical protein
MNTLQHFPRDVIATIPTRDAKTDLMTRLDRLRDRFARHAGLPFADRPARHRDRRHRPEQDRDAG